MRMAKLYPIDGGARWGAPWHDATGRRRAVTAARPEEAVAKRAKWMAGWTSDESLGEFLRWWTTEYLPRRVANGRLAEETMDGYESSVRLHIVPRLGDVGLTDLTAPLLEDWLDDLADDGLGPRGRQKALRTLSVALTVAVRATSSGATLHATLRVRAWSRSGSRRGPERRRGRSSWPPSRRRTCTATCD